MTSTGTTNSQYIYTRVWEIFETLHPKPDDLISTSRFFVRDGEMFLWDEKKKKKKKRYFFLFNDILLLCRKESHKKYWLRIHITLRSPYVSIEEIENSSYNNEFRLHCRSRSFILYASSPEQKKEWIQDLQHSISGTHGEENKDDKDKNKEKKEEKDDKKERRKSVKKEKSPTSLKKQQNAMTILMTMMILRIVKMTNLHHLQNLKKLFQRIMTSQKSLLALKEEKKKRNPRKMS